ncbi:MAG: riboflavin biosynthesis protein RibF, partial [Calditrichaeota bacterium]|nr:riboflavin biosynthesis protein RibF [Calditrichota bacterium]
MEVFRKLESVQKEKNAVITVGTFDGVHIGHVFVINSLLERAHQGGSAATLVTFDPHPKLVLNPPAAATISI